ncbi:11988_t:CDS:2, partial [Funneliformis mosseae]
KQKQRCGWSKRKEARTRIREGIRNESELSFRITVIVLGLVPELQFSCSLQEENERLQSTVTFQQPSDKDNKIQELYAVNEELHYNFLQACLKINDLRLKD